MARFEDLADGGVHRRIRVYEDWERLGPGYERARDDFLAVLAASPSVDDLIMCGGLLHGTWLGETVFPANDFYFVFMTADLHGPSAVRKLEDVIRTVTDGKPHGEGGTRFLASGASARQTNRSLREDELEFVFEHGYPMYMLCLPWLDADGRTGQLKIEVWCEAAPPSSDITVLARPTGGDPIVLHAESPEANLEHMLRFLLVPPDEPAFPGTWKRPEQRTRGESRRPDQRIRAAVLHSAALLAETLQPRRETRTSPTSYVPYGQSAPTVFFWYTHEHHRHLGSLRYQWPSGLGGTPEDYTRRLQAALAPLLDTP